MEHGLGAGLEEVDHRATCVITWCMIRHLDELLLNTMAKIAKHGQ